MLSKLLPQKLDRNLFRLKKELNYTVIKDRKNLCGQEKETKSIKDRILRENMNLLRHEEENYKPVRIIFGVTLILNVKAMVIEIKHHQLKKISIKLDHIQKTS